MSIPNSFIQEVVARTDIVQLIGERISLKKSGANHMACCPFHQEKTPSFSVSESRQMYHCFGCGESGNVIGFLVAYDNMTFPQAVEYLAHLQGLEIPKEGQTTPDLDPKLYEVLQTAASFYQHQLRNSTEAIDYLKNRGLNGEVAKRFSLGFATDSWRQLLQHYKAPEHQQALVTTGMLIDRENKKYDRFRHRIMIPIRDVRGRVIGFGGRALNNDNPPKYLNSPETPLFHKSHELFGLYEARLANKTLNRIVICEGYLDVMALYQFGITYAVATLGTASNLQHIYKLLRYTQHLIFCFDGDSAGRAAAWKALTICLPLMHEGIRVEFIFLPDQEDPDSFIRKEGPVAFTQRLDQATPLSHVLFQYLLQDENLNSLDNKAAFAKKVLTWIEKIKPGIYQDLMKKQLSDLIQLNLSDFSAAPTPKMTKTQTIDNTSHLVKKALILLLQNAEVAPELPFAEAKKNIDLLLLNDLIQRCQAAPKQPIGSILSGFEPALQQKLYALAHTRIDIPKEEQVIELRAILEKYQHNIRDEIDQLLNKAKAEGLSQTEKKRLQTLLQQQTTTEPEP